MNRDRNILIIGGGIAGLCAGVYAQRCGYDATILEQHSETGGLATSWRRGGYTFETCLHWLLGSKRGGYLNALWREVCDIDSLSFVNHDLYVRLEAENGETLNVFTDPDRLQAEWLAASPEDADAIRQLVSAIEHLKSLPVPEPGDSWQELLGEFVQILPDLPLLWNLSRMSSADYGRRFRHPLMQRFFDDGATGRISVLALLFSMAWMGSGNAGYAVGGAKSLTQAIHNRFTDLGGKVRCNASVGRILVEGGSACGVELADGETLRAHAVLSAADGHTTLNTMLGGRYRSEALDTAYESFETFPSYVQVSLGVGRDLSDLPGLLTLVLDRPLAVDPTTIQSAVTVRVFHFDPTFAPAGKTAVTVFLPTYNVSYWDRLRREDPHHYQAVKHRLAETVVAVLDKRVPGLAQAVEVMDISTPASVIRYTGNWNGSMEGWLPTPRTPLSGLPQTLHGLEHFAMAGQWVQPGGGLPSGVLTARSAVAALCREDSMPFLAPAEV
ncbi:NAD(P)/FAD-dependent oxidoreductase [Asticcacaulis sp. AC402]|uniref:phytoene desaturase family protein n=1 Tax=Asticcacaulis sp. AC402 TaxID=1282361 RepID=UPI00041334B5|nr:NAD(P)/FAD-dependent oxidoreductase [Asticcacaulis sp. AC402]